jgi:hypothetical protein
MRDLVGRDGPLSATFEHAKAFVAFIQWFGTRAQLEIQMATSPPPLDPQKYPWNRGDVVTSGFKKSGFVLDSTADYLEVMWMPGSTTERIAKADADNLLRVAHAGSLAPKSDKTNLELLMDLLALDRIKVAVRDRIASLKTEAEKKSVDLLINRSLANDGCDWDKAHHAKLFDLAIKPSSVGTLFKLQERIHRLFCKRH